MATVELPGVDGRPSVVEIPEGWERLTEGAAQHGDRYWHWPDASWRTVKDSHTFLGQSAGLLQCLIRRSAS